MRISRSEPSHANAEAPLRTGPSGPCGVAATDQQYRATSDVIDSRVINGRPVPGDSERLTGQRPGW